MSNTEKQDRSYIVTYSARNGAIFTNLAIARSKHEARLLVAQRHGIEPVSIIRVRTLFGLKNRKMLGKCRGMT